MTTKVINKLVNICTNLDSGSSLIDLVYPVGSIYTSMDPTSPADRFGGTWEQIIDRFLYCAHYSSGLLDGSSAITTENLPSHTHTFSGTQATDSLQFRRNTGANNVHTMTDGSATGIFSLNEQSGDKWSAALSDTSGSHNTDVITWTYTPEGTLSVTGEGSEYLPPYITVYAWYRTA